ncbi:hypothetical protein A4G99_03770 [Haladaptatus sp. R4]|uniref:hypothetical protein n=1 Tax=Haladaptatus sp. R4 TaxID=1679489 RepID=UPI0007B4A05C|nr:hypothetical protein [Haladaptatus sp. R4]KZN25598.1 hypothetical protein A4G99_03770 [Haladaptatus sp. R4]
MFDDIPKLKASPTAKVWEIVCKPMWLFAVLLQGTTAIHFDANGIEFKNATRIDDPDGVLVDGEFIPADGPGSFYRLYNTDFVITVGDMTELLTPGALADLSQVDDAVVADGGIVTAGDGIQLVVPTNGRSLGALLAKPIWFAALSIQGATAIQIDENRRLSFKKASRERTPQNGYVVDDEFKRADGTGAVFTKYGSDVVLSLEGWESLWNPATPEILRAKDVAETNGEQIGANDGEKTVVECRQTTAVNVDRLAEYPPFSMLDGTSTRQQMNSAYEARSKYKDGSTLGKILAILTAFMLGAISPRLNGAVSGGSGGGGSGFSMPMPYLAPPPMDLSMPVMHLSTFHLSNVAIVMQGMM